MTETRTYYAVSLFSSRTFWFNALSFVVMALAATDVLVIIPAKALPFVTALVTMINIWLRTETVRPVALIAPGATKAVQVPALSPPDPPVVTD